MSFNKNAFAASFLNQLTAGIEEREEKAEEYERQQKAAAERNAAIVSTRKLRADEAVQLANKARTLGARPEHIAAAMSSGMTGISQLYQKLQDAANQKGVRKLGESDIEAIVNMPVVPPINGDLVDFNLRELADKTFGVAKLDKAKEPEPSGNVLRRLFGLDEMSVARKRLQDTEYVEGMSIADINEAARQAEYTSLFPDLGFTLMDVEFYGPAAKGKFVNDFKEAASDAISGTVAETFIQTQVNNYIDEKAATREPATPSEIAQVRKDAQDYLIQQAVREVILENTSAYGRGGFFDDPTTTDLIRETMGEDFLIDQMNLYGKELEEDQTTEPTNTEQDQEKVTGDDTPTQEEATEEEAPSTEDKEEEVSTETYPTRPTGVSRKDRKKAEQWDKKYKGKVDPDTGSVIVVEPRPSEEITTVKGTRGGRKVTVSAAKEWDKKYADTHNPDGLPKL